MRYKVTITETLEMEVEVNAKSRAEAEQKIEVRWHNGEYILVRELIVETTPIAFPPIEYQEVLRELRKIGINLNQLASKAHTLGFVDEREYRAESERLWRVVAELAKPMTKGGVKFGNHKDMGC